MTERPSDERLLTILGEALSGDTTAPPPEGLAALHAAVDRRAMGQPLFPEPARPIGRVWERLGGIRWDRPVGVAAIVAGSVVAGGGVAFASGAPVPPPIRELATHLGLPVTPQSVVNVHNTESSLTKALQQSPPDPTTVTTNPEVNHYAGTLRRQVEDLTPQQRRDEDAKAQSLLSQAARQDDQAQNDNANSGSQHSGAGQNNGNQNNQGDNGKAQNQNGSGDHHHSGSTTTTTLNAGSHRSRSGGDDNQQGGGSTTVRFGSYGDHYSSTTAAVPHDRSEGDYNR